MSFFQDVPPPLDDDKSRDFDEYDLEDDNSSRISTEFPKNIHLDVIHNNSSPPELNAALFFDEPPPDDDYQPSKVSRDDSFEEYMIYEKHSTKDVASTVIEDTAVIDSIEGSKLSQFEEVEDYQNHQESSNNEESSSISESEKGPGELVLSPVELNQNEIILEDLPPLETKTIYEDTSKSDNEVFSSFSTSLTCNDDNIKDNLHNKFTEKDNYETHEVGEETNHESIMKDDEDDDEFSNFEAAIPINRTVEAQASTTIDNTPFEEEVRFEADFSSFNDQKDDDDDFDDDFNDFESAPTDFAQETQTHSIEFVKPANVKALVDEIFPAMEQGNEESIDEVRQDILIKNDALVKKLDDFDSTLALGFLYSNSTASQTLVKALGIDTRNILLGPQWASNMPRFASNLSFNPLEPLKGSASECAANNKFESIDAKISAPPKSDVVPDVQFDWTSSGLVNPLDGKQPNIQQSNEAKPTAVFKSTSPITVAQSSFEIDPTSHAVDEKEMTQPEATETSIGTDLDSHLSKFSSWEPPSFQAPPTNSILVRERTIKLPETHIFTPVKSTSPVAREVKSRDASPSNTIVVKEYHDIEYLEPTRKIELENDFDDFQSAFVEPTPPPVALLPTSSLSILEPLKVENQQSNTIAWPNPGEILEDFSFMELSGKDKETKPTSVKELPVIGNSPSKKQITEMDDFADFQAAPIISMPNLKPQPYQNPLESIQTSTQVKSTENKSNEPLTLSPSKLVSTMNKPQKSSWINSMDDEEIHRIEAAFPKCKVSPKPQPKSNEMDEEEWSDFVGVSSQNVSNHQKSFNDDNWSDFVSAPPATVNSISSQILSKPNFTSWNHPVPARTYHATSFLSSDSKSYNSPGYQYGQQQPEMTITNNFNYQPNRSISTILPDLDFAMPRNLINLPRSDSSGKK